jgi:hypothetical protein
MIFEVLVRLLYGWLYVSFDQKLSDILRRPAAISRSAGIDLDRFEDQSELMCPCTVPPAHATHARAGYVFSASCPSNQLPTCSHCDAATEYAWKAAYRGRDHELLENNIKKMNEERKHHTSIYSNMVSMIQSSGTGKSRMVHELARRVFTLPFNLRTRDADIGM